MIYVHLLHTRSLIILRHVNKNLHHGYERIGIKSCGFSVMPDSIAWPDHSHLIILKSLLQMALYCW